MGRLPLELLDRTRSFSVRIIGVAETLEGKRRSQRIVHQVIGAGTSVGANAYEADEALSRADFCKTLGIIIKELNEARFWLLLIAEKGWIAQTRLGPLQAQAAELKKIFGAMLTRTRARSRRAAP